MLMYDFQDRIVRRPAMKTVITDRTLSYAKYNPSRVTGDILGTYIKAVMSCGTDYIEINSATAELLGDTDFSENYILALQQLSDIELCRKHRFAYVLLPFGLLSAIDLIPEEQPIILEKAVDEYSAHAIIMYLHRFTFIRRISAIRITGIFGESMPELVKWCGSKLFMPIDICPLNTMMTGTCAAIDAMDAHAAMLTLSFGKNYYYTALEDVIVGYNTTRRILIDSKVIKAICAASFLYVEIFNAVPAGLARMVESESNLTAPVFDTETGMLFKPYKIFSRRREDKDDIVTRKIKDLGLERDLEEAVLDAVKKVSLNLYNAIKKGNETD